jgi:hypothetical protein
MGVRHKSAIRRVSRDLDQGRELASAEQSVHEWQPIFDRAHAQIVRRAEIEVGNYNAATLQGAGAPWGSSLQHNSGLI